MSGVRRLGYLAHPVRGDVPGNVACAKRWWRYLLKAYPDVAIVAPWIVELEWSDDADEAQRAAGLERNYVAVSRCDVIFLCGGCVSSGMLLEAATATAAGAEAIDLTHLGPEPPPT